MDFGQNLQAFSLFHGATDFGGGIEKGKAAPPKRVLKDRRPGGTNLKARTQHGWDLDDFEFSGKGLTLALVAITKGRTLDTQQIVLRSAHRDEWTGETRTLEIEAWGRTEEHDIFGELQGEEDTEWTIKFVPALATWRYGGTEAYHYNIRTGEVRVDGEDETEPTRGALGRS